MDWLPPTLVALAGFGAAVWQIRLMRREYRDSRLYDATHEVYRVAMQLARAIEAFRAGHERNHAKEVEVARIELNRALHDYRFLLREDIAAKIHEVDAEAQRVMANEGSAPVLTELLIPELEKDLKQLAIR